MRLVTCFQFFLIAACLPSLSAQPFSKADLQTLFTDPAAIATKIKQAPTLDRSLKEEAWKAADVLKLGFSDANTPGTPKNWTNVRLVSDAQALYVSFDCREVGSIITRASSPENVPADDHVMLLLPTDGRDAFVHIKVNSRGIVWSSKHEGLDPKKKGKTLSIEGLEASARRYPGRWAAEVKVPFAGLFADLKKMPTIWKANFARKRHSKLWSSVKPTDIGYANWTLSWKTTMNLAVFKPDPDLFGVVYLAAG
ncbi:MAG: hypothetical protein QF473_12395 [Planctomycetota bacterium]|nr:hypothetical protein [Planctomycetota bacterium]